MKKTIIVCAIIAFLSIISIGMFAVTVPSVLSYIISKITSIEFHISKIDYKYKDMTVILNLKDISMKGMANGNIGRLEFSAGIKEGFRIKSILCTDFELKMADAKGKKRIFPVFADALEIKNGKVQYGAQTFVIHGIKINDLRPGKTFTFTMHVENDYWFKGLETSGEGIYAYKGGFPDIKGNIHVSGVDLNKFSDKLKGRANANGGFKIEKKEFSFNGPFEVTDYKEIKASSVPLISIENIKGDVLFTRKDDAMDIKVSRMFLKDTPLALNLKLDKTGLTHLDISSKGFIDLNEIKSCADIKSLAGVSFDIWNIIPAGKVKIKRLIFSDGHRFNTDVELKNAVVSYRNLLFNNVDGFVSIDNSRLNISGCRGNFKTSLFSNVSGVIPFSKDKEMDLKGEYAFNLADVPFLFDVGDVKFKKGETVGTLKLKGNENKGYMVSGVGQLNNADVIWKKTSATAKGFYTFNNDEIAFDPLHLSKGATNITIKGKWHKKFMDFKIKGLLDVLDLKPFFAEQRFEVSGTTGIDLSVRRSDDVFALNGDTDMDNVSFELPGIVKKKSGIHSRASLSITVRNRDILIEKLLYSLDIVELGLTGNIEDYKTINFDAALKAAGVESAAPLFYLDSETTRGSVALNIAVRGLTFPVVQLPYISGYANVQDGVLKLPWLEETIKDINLTSNFNGVVFDINAKHVRFGKNMLKEGTFRVQGVDYPRFSLNVEMDNIELGELEQTGDFRIPLVYKDSIMSKATADILLKAKTVKASHLKGENLFARAYYDKRVLNVSDLKMGSADGNLDVKGSVDFSDPVPHVKINGKSKNFLGKLLLESLNQKSRLIEGSTSIYGSINSSGSTVKELTGNMSGNIAIYSQDGSIKRWNMLSKIFGLLNVSDVFRGKSELTKEGLPYKKMGATFQIDSGILTTNDFIVDSPSMLITGSGNLNMKTQEIDAVIAVSPLVTLDRILYKIPVLSSILMKSGKGIINAGYNVKGPFENPDITLSFKNNVGFKTIELLRKIFVLPKGMLE